MGITFSDGPSPAVGSVYITITSVIPGSGSDCDNDSSIGFEDGDQMVIRLVVEIVMIPIPMSFQMTLMEMVTVLAMETVTTTQVTPLPLISIRASLKIITMEWMKTVMA